MSYDFAMAAHPITLDPDLQQRLERVAQREVRSPEFVLRDAVEMYLHARGETDEAAEHDTIWDGYDVPTVTREQMLADVIAASEEYDRTGLHVTWEEADAWLAKLQAGEDATPPECHV